VQPQASRDSLARDVAIAWTERSEANLIELLATRRATRRARFGGIPAVTAADRRKAIDAVALLMQGTR
jgi:hypothetical protein